MKHHITTSPSHHNITTSTQHHVTKMSPNYFITSTPQRQHYWRQHLCYTTSPHSNISSWQHPQHIISIAITSARQYLNIMSSFGHHSIPTSSQLLNITLTFHYWSDVSTSPPCRNIISTISHYDNSSISHYHDNISILFQILINKHLSF